MPSETIAFTDLEHSDIKKLAAKENLSVCDFIKTKILNISLCSIYMDELEDKIAKLKKDSVFSISTLLIDKWDKIRKSDKIILGKQFRKKVETKEINDVEYIENTASNMSLYKKK